MTKQLQDDNGNVIPVRDTSVKGLHGRLGGYRQRHISRNTTGARLVQYRCVCRHWRVGHYGQHAGNG